MANFIYLTLDTTAPSNPSISIAGGSTYATKHLVDVNLGCGDASKTGYQMKIWGDVDAGHDSNVQATEGASAWITWASVKQIRLSNGDGTKTISYRVRDDVYNQSSIASDNITLDTSLPVPTITGPDVSKISKVTGRDRSAFSFTVGGAYTEFKVKVVGSTGASHDTGTTIANINGSQNMQGDAGNYNGATPMNCIIDGTDLENASSGDGQKIVKVFVKDEAGNWSA